MFTDPARMVLVAALVLLSVSVALERLARIRFPFSAYLRYLWVFLLCFGGAELYSPKIAVWVLAALCFGALRE